MSYYYDPEIYKVNNISCIKDIDCNDLKYHCYINPNKTTGFCSCWSIHGFTIDSKCTTLSITGYVDSIFTIIITIFYAYVLIFLTIPSLKLNIQTYGIKSIMNKPNIRVVIYCFISLCFLIGTMAIIIQRSTNPTYKRYYTKDGVNLLVEQGMVAITAIAFGYFALLEILIVWKTIVLKAKKLTSSVDLTKTKFIIYTIQTLYIIGQSVLYGLELINIAIGINIIWMLVILFLYVKTGLNLKKELVTMHQFESKHRSKAMISKRISKNFESSKSLDNEHAQEKETQIGILIKNLIRCIKSVTIILLIAVIFALIYLTLVVIWTVKKYENEPGQTNSSRFAFHFFYIFVGLSFMEMLKYMSSVFDNSTKQNNLKKLTKMNSKLAVSKDDIFNSKGSSIQSTDSKNNSKQVISEHQSTNTISKINPQ